MYTEVLKIIEGGLKRDSKKILNYAQLLAEKLVRDGDEKGAQMIRRLLEAEKPKATVTMDEIMTTPVDHESRLNIVDVEMPGQFESTVVLNKMMESKIADFINTIKNQQKLKKHGIDTASSLLLYGPPGCGKSTIARYISKQTGLPLVVAQFDAIVSSLLGNTAKNIRKIFDFADQRPCILFLDEFDAIAKARDDQYELGELKRVINSLLQNIDSFSKDNILIAATNHPELLDKAIWRRFHTVIEIGLPQQEEITGLLYGFIDQFKNNLFDDKKQIDRLLQLLNGKSPADIKVILNNAMSDVLISDRNELSYEDVLMEIFDFNHHGAGTLEQVIEFLNDNGVTQAAIAEKLKISMRQVRNRLSKDQKTETDG